MAGNPRIDELRKKLDKEPGSRLFAQLAEELRKDGEFEDAIRVAREGLQKHQNYPSARLTLGRALFDTGDWAAARVEFEQVLKGAPDNILASRLLAESLEGLGDVPGAVARYKKTLGLAPGDKQVLARLEALEGGGAGVPAPAASVPAAGARPAAGIRPTGPAIAAPPIPAQPAPVADVSAPIRLVEVDSPMELERPLEREAQAAPVMPTSAASASVSVPPTSEPAAAPMASRPAAEPTPRLEPAPIPLAAADEHFEIERPNEPPRSSASEASAAVTVAPRSAPSPAAPPAPRSHEAAMEFEFEAGPAGSTIPFAPAPAAPPVSAPGPEASTPVEHRDEARTIAIVPSAPAVAPAPAPPPSPPPAPAEAATTVEMPWTATAPTPSSPSPAPSSPAAPSPSAREGEGATGELMSPTLAELYFNQGFTDKAVEVYRQLLDREPDNDRLRRRLHELQAPAAAAAPAVAPAVVPAMPAAPAPTATAAPGPPSDAAIRRVALERTIARLEGMLAAIKKG